MAATAAATSAATNGTRRDIAVRVTRHKPSAIQSVDPACVVAWKAVADNPGVVEVAPERFEAMVVEALDGLPAELGDLMSNVAVIVEHREGPQGLLGLYHGVPLTRRTTTYSGVLPDRITIYRRAICAVCSTEQEVVEQVRKTVVHEVGHHFGISDARLRQLGW